MNRLRHTTAALAVATLVSWPAIARAQKWELEVHVGAAIASGATGGTVSALPAGEAFTTGAGFPSVRVSSWLFGDGAALFNAASALAGRPERISSLDGFLGATSVNRRSGAAVGFRVTRALTSRFDAEFSLDYAASGLAMSDAAVSQIEASRQTFITAFSGLFSSTQAIFGNNSVSATASLKKNAGQRLFVSGGVLMHLSDGGRRPYVVAGVAMARDSESHPTAAIDGSYKFTTNAAVPPFTINESDHLSIGYVSKASLLGMAGFGFNVASWTGSGLRFDARVFLGTDEVETVLDAQGTPHDSNPPGAAYTFTSPALQWSSGQDAVGRSSLSGSVTGFRTLTGTRFQAPVVVTLGYFFRF